jgi:hypothetical protein
MTASADRYHRPRTFFGPDGAVRRLLCVGGSNPDGRRSNRPRRSLAVEPERGLESERTGFATQLDRQLRLACRGEAAVRRELGCAARAFLSRQAYRPLGFVRLGDYARERLGVSARTLQHAAWLATRLDALPAISRAYDRSELSWAQARALCSVAAPADEERWLGLTRGATVETLERLAAQARWPDGVPEDSRQEGVPQDGPGGARSSWRRGLPGSRSRRGARPRSSPRRARRDGRSGRRSETGR